MEEREEKKGGRKWEWCWFFLFLRSRSCSSPSLKTPLFLLFQSKTTHRPGLPLRADHRSPLCDPPQGFPQVAAAAHERDPEVVLVDVVHVVGRGQHLRLVDVIHSESLENLRLDEVADARLGHDRDGHRCFNRLDHVRVAHARDASVAADVRGHALERHDGDGAGLLGDAGLLGGCDVHDDALLEHLGEADLFRSLFVVVWVGGRGWGGAGVRTKNG